MQKQIQEEAESMLKMGLITKSKSPWMSPIVMAPKKDKTFCVDYRKLSAITQPHPYSIPQVDDLLDLLGVWAKFISTLDLACEYWPLDAEVQNPDVSCTLYLDQN